MQKVRERGLQDRISADSAGTGSWHIGEEAHLGTRRTLNEKGIAYAGRARQISPHDLTAFDYLLTMDDSNYADVKALPPGTAQIFRFLEFAPGCGFLEVPDPWYTGDLEQTYALVSQAADGFLDFLKQEHTL